MVKWEWEEGKMRQSQLQSSKEKSSSREAGGRRRTTKEKETEEKGGASWPVANITGQQEGDR